MLAALTGFAVLMASICGCRSSGEGGKSVIRPPFSQGGDSRADEEALRKAVEKDPFPRAKARAVDLDA